jgi:hypothetical protein
LPGRVAFIRFEGTTAPWRDSSGTSATATFERLAQQPASQTARHHEASGLLECVQRPNETLFVPSGWWHTTLNLQPSLAITENFAAESNLDEVLAELAKRPKRTPEGRETATAHCLNALQWLVAAEVAADARRRSVDLGRRSEAVTATRYPGPGPLLRAGENNTASAVGTGRVGIHGQAYNYHSWAAAVRFGQNAPDTHLILFLASKKDSLGAKRATAALRTAARRAVVRSSSLELVQIVEVQPSGEQTRDLMRQFGVTAKGSEKEHRPTVRVATARATLFRYSPPEEVMRALVDIINTSSTDSLVEEGDGDNNMSEAGTRLETALVEWLVGIENGQAKPYLTAADRRVLLALMEHDKK